MSSAAIAILVSVAAAPKRLDAHSSTVTEPREKTSLSVAGLFAGIGGIEVGLGQAGHQTEFLCEIDEAAVAVLEARFAGRELVRDVTELDELPDVDLVAGGFPCQDLSQAGRTAGIRGRNSGLVGHLFDLLEKKIARPQWLLLENVPFMLQLGRGEAMKVLTSSLERLGYRWAYRVVDARAFGLPQRRQRVILLASLEADPGTVLFSEDAGEPKPETDDGKACGFYWTEGVRGLGWAVDAIPTLKGGSSIGIPSPPAIRMPDRQLVTPDIRDAERLQGFPTDWTEPALDIGRRGRGSRWKLVGNAVNVRVARWVGERLAQPAPYSNDLLERLPDRASWPVAACGSGGRSWKVAVSRWPRQDPYESLTDFLRFPPTPLSLRATAGFYSRTQISSLRFPRGFLEDVQAHMERMQLAADAA